MLPQRWDTGFSTSENEVEGRGKERHALFSPLPVKACFCFHTWAGERKKTEFKAKHLRAFKMVLLICTLVDSYLTAHAEQTVHILPGTYQSTFRLFFPDLRFQDSLGGIQTYIFIKKIQLRTC